MWIVGSRDCNCWKCYGNRLGEVMCSMHVLIKELIPDGGWMLDFGMWVLSGRKEGDGREVGGRII